jgi:hypothetical protein
MPRNRYEAIALQRRIDTVINHADSLDPGDEAAAELAKYLCILGSGLVECTIRTAVRQLVKRTNPVKGVANAATAYAETVQNPQFDRVVAFATSLNPEIGKKIKCLDEQHSGALNSLVKLRHQLAHGDNASNISMATVKGHLQNISPILRLLESLAGP